MAGVVPDPVSAFNESFRTADTSARDYLRLQMQTQNEFNKAVQDKINNARQQKADDFKMMMMALERGDRLKEAEIDNRRSDQQLGVSKYSAATSRYNATNPRSGRRYSDDPLGILGGTTETEVDVTAEDIPPPNSDATLSPTGGWGQGVNADTSNPNNASIKALEADINTFVNGGLPDSYKTDSTQQPLIDGPPPATAYIDGNPANFVEPTQQPPKAVPIAEVVTEESVAQVPPAPPVSEPVAESPKPQPGVNPMRDSLMEEVPPPPPVSIPEGVNAIRDSLIVESPAPVEVPALSEQDITQDTRNLLFNLERQSKELSQTAAMSKTRASMIAQAAKTLRDPSQYSALALQEAQKSIQAAGAAQEAAVKAERLQAELPKIQKRQEVIASLSNLTGVLPSEEVNNIIKMASDPAKGGQVDRDLLTLSAYSKIREQRGLVYESNGIKTAEKVARSGAMLSTKDAEEDRLGYEAVALATQALKDPTLEPDEVKAYKKEIRDNAPKASRWVQRNTEFVQAVEEDRVKDPQAPAQPSADAAPKQDPPSIDIISEGNELAVSMQSGPTMSREDQDYWTKTKGSLRQLLGDEGVRQAIASQGGVKTLEEMKQALRLGVVRLTAGKGRENSEKMYQTVLPNGNPKNARGLMDVVNALAEDIWRGSGREAGAKAVKGAAPISSENRPIIESITSKFEKKTPAT